MECIHVAIYLSSTRRTYQEDPSHQFHVNNFLFVAELISNSVDVEEYASSSSKKKKSCSARHGTIPA